MTPVRGFKLAIIDCGFGFRAFLYPATRPARCLTVAGFLLLAPPTYCECFGWSPHTACKTVRTGDLQDVHLSLIFFSEPTFIFDLNRKLGLRDPKALTQISMG